MIKNFFKLPVFVRVLFFTQILFYNYAFSFLSENSQFPVGTDAASMMLSMKDDPNFREELSKISGIVEPEILDGIMDQLKSMEGDSEEALAKQKEFNDICNQMMNEIQGDTDFLEKPQAAEKEFDNHIHLEDEKDYEELPDEQKNNIHCNDWLDVLRNCQTPLSKYQKKIFREGIFSFEKIIKSIKSEHNSNYLLYSDLKINMELLGINLHQFRRPFKMRYLFENKPETKQLRNSLADSIEKIESLIILQEKKRERKTSLTLESETSFLGSFWASKKKEKGKTAKSSNIKGDKKIGRLLLDITKSLSSNNKQLDKILISKEMLSKEGLKKKMNHVVKSYAKSKYPTSYGRYEDRLSRAGSEYGDYGNGRESSRSGGWDNWTGESSPSNDFGNGIEGKSDSSSGTNSNDSKPQVFSGPAVFEKHIELISLLESEDYKSLLALDSYLSVLDKNSIKKLTESFLDLKFSSLNTKIDSVLKSLNISYGKNNSDGGTKDEKKDMSKEEIAVRKKNVREAISKIFRPIYYLNNNLRKIKPIFSDNKSDDRSNSILILPALSMLEGETEVLTALSKTIKNPCIDTCLALQTFYARNNTHFSEISNSISSVLSKIETEIEEKKKTEISKTWEIFSDKIFLENDSIIFSMLNNLLASVSSFTFDSKDFCTNLTNFLETILLIHFDYPSVSGILTLEKNQKLMKIFFNEFSKVFKKHITTILQSKDSNDDLLMHNILSSFEDFTEGLGHRKTTNSFQSQNANIAKKIMRSTVLLCNIFGNTVFSEEIILNDQNGSDGSWAEVFSDLKLLLNFKKETEIFSQENRVRISGKTTDYTFSKIPQEYRDWCLGEADVMNNSIFDLYQRVLAQINYLSESKSETFFEETIKNINKCLEKIDTEKDSFDIKKIKSNFVIRTISILSSYHPLGENIVLDNSNLDPKGVNSGNLFLESEGMLSSISFLYEYKSSLLSENKSLSLISDSLLFHKNKIAEELVFMFLDLDIEKISLNESAKKIDNLLTEASSIRSAFWQLKKIITAGSIGDILKNKATEESVDAHSLAIKFRERIDIPSEFIFEDGSFNKKLFENDSVSPFLLIVQLMNPSVLELIDKASIEVVFSTFIRLDYSLTSMSSSLEQIDLDKIASMIIEKGINTLTEKTFPTSINSQEILQNLTDSIAKYFNVKVSENDLPQSKANFYNNLVKEFASV